MYIVTWLQKQSNEWTTHVVYYDSKKLAKQHHDSLLPGEGGSFGPIEYINITLAKVIEYVAC